VDRNSVERITGRIGPFLETLLTPGGFFVVDITMRGVKNERVIEVFIDGDQGVTTAACTEISKALSKELDENVLKGEGYTLTVSSPGLDRPLKFPRQYAKHVGREILLRVRSGSGDTRIEGTLVGAGDKAISVEVLGGKAPAEIPHAAILEARIKPRW
jgi:ribosome maturation factor RimP